MTVYVDPYRGNVLGARPDRSTVMWTVRYLHSLCYFGPVARGVIEIVGGWTILLVSTEIYLWWPRGRSGGVRGDRRRRVLWRDTHAVTGMPWSQVWGGEVYVWANGYNFARPPAFVKLRTSPKLARSTRSRSPKRWQDLRASALSRRSKQN